MVLTHVGIRVHVKIASRIMLYLCWHQSIRANRHTNWRLIISKDIKKLRITTRVDSWLTYTTVNIQLIDQNQAILTIGCIVRNCSNFCSWHYGTVQCFDMLIFIPLSIQQMGLEHYIFGLNIQYVHCMLQNGMCVCEKRHSPTGLPLTPNNRSIF